MVLKRYGKVGNNRFTNFIKGVAFPLNSRYYGYCNQGERSNYFPQPLFLVVAKQKTKKALYTTKTMGQSTLQHFV